MSIVADSYLPKIPKIVRILPLQGHGKLSGILHFITKNLFPVVGTVYLRQERSFSFGISKKYRMLTFLSVVSNYFAAPLKSAMLENLPPWSPRLS